MESTDGSITSFDPEKVVVSLMNETGLDKEKAIEVTTNVLRRLSALDMNFITAPHLRELVCSELTSMGLHKYRAQYTRLGIPIYDVRRMLKERKGRAFFTLLAAQVIEQFVHLDRLNEDAQVVVDEITEYAQTLEPDLKDIIMKSMENALSIDDQKKKEHLV